VEPQGDRPAPQECGRLLARQCHRGRPGRGVRILNNSVYKGQVVRNRSRWTRGEVESKARFVERVDEQEWITTTDESLGIVNEPRERVGRLQTDTDARRVPVRGGIAAKRTKGNGSKVCGAG
jgi:hypothetical protein